MVKITGRKKLVRVYHEKWPDNIEYTFNILKDQSGRIVLIAESPESESGDWDIQYIHYFDQNGKTYAFSKTEAIFDDRAKGGVIREELMKFFDENLHNLKTSNQLLDLKSRPIKGNVNRWEFRNYPYKIYPTLEACLKGYNISL